MADWYVRPDTSHSGTRDGTSYATAWGGWSAITWGGGGVTAGDTLYVCGSHTAAANVSIGAHLGLVASRVTIDGGYAADPGSITFTAAGFLSAARSYNTVQNLTVNAYAGSPCIFQSGASLAGTYFLDNTLVGGTYGVQLSSAGVYTDVKINGNTISGCTERAITYTPTAVSSVFGPIECNNNTISDIAQGETTDGEGIRLTIESAAWTTSTFAAIQCNRNNIQRVRAHAIWVRSGNGDLTTVPAVYSTRCEMNGNVIKGNGYVAGDYGAHGGLSVHGFTHAQASGNIVWDCYVTGAGIQTAKNVYMLVRNNDIRRIRSGTSTGLYQNGFPIDGNGIFFDNLTVSGYAAWNYVEDLISTGNDNSGTGLAFWTCTNCTFEANVVVNCYRGASYGNSAETGNKLIGNTFINCTAGVDKVGTQTLTGAMTAKNNLFVSCATAYNIDTNPGINESYSWIYGSTTAYAGISQGSGSTVGTDPQLSTDYRPLPGSPLLGAGTHLGYTRDCDGHQRANPPAIGAFEPATLRAVLTTDPA